MPALKTLFDQALAHARQQGHVHTFVRPHRTVYVLQSPFFTPTQTPEGTLHLVPSCDTPWTHLPFDRLCSPTPEDPPADAFLVQEALWVGVTLQDAASFWEDHAFVMWGTHPVRVN
jgi:hypothetical protein